MTATTTATRSISDEQKLVAMELLELALSAPREIASLNQEEDDATRRQNAEEDAADSIRDRQNDRDEEEAR